MTLASTPKNYAGCFDPDVRAAHWRDRALRCKAAARQHSVQDVARDAVRSHTSSAQRVAEIAPQVVEEDQGLLRRLAEP